MSYALNGFRGLGAATGPNIVPCGANAGINPTSKECECLPGFQGDDCAPINISVPCTYPGQQRSPIDKKCYCPPGQLILAGPGGTECIPMQRFPDCVDALGRRVPNCIKGHSIRDVAIFAGAGAVAGLVLGMMFGKLSR